MSRDDEVLTGSGPRDNYATDENLTKRQSIFTFLDPETSTGGTPIERLTLRGEETVIDCGCGNGLWFSYVRPRVARAVGMDLSVGMAGAARDMAGPGTSVVQADIQKMPFANASADGLLAMHMLYHVADLPAALSELRRVLKPAGWVFITTNSGVPNGSARLYHSAVEAAAGESFDHILPPLSFDAENAATLLGPYFRRMEPAEHVAGFAVTQAEALVPPLESVAELVEATIGRTLDWSAVYRRVVQDAQDGINSSGAFRYEQRVVSFLCRP